MKRLMKFSLGGDFVIFLQAAMTVQLHFECNQGEIKDRILKKAQCTSYQ